MTWLIASAAAALVVGWLVRRVGARPFVNKVPAADLPRFMDALLRRGYDGGFAIVEDRNKRAFLHVVKYIRPQRQIGLRLNIPVAPWSEAAVERVATILNEQGKGFETEATGEPVVRAFLWCDVGDDIDVAATVVNRVMREGFGTEGDYYRITFCKVSVKDETISS